MEKGISIHLAPSVLGHIGSFTITNTYLTVTVVTALLILVAFLLTRKLTLVPSRAQIVLESLIYLPYKYIEETLENAKLAEKVYPIILTIFIFVLTVNWFGLLPFIGSVGIAGESHGEHSFIPLFYPGATDLNFTLALALIAFFTIEVAGFATLGALTYAKKFINFSSPISFFVGIMELVSEFARIITFAFRLFGNIFAGKVLILVIMFFAPLLAPVPLLAFEVFVGFIQAVIFALLTLFFIKLAIAHHDESAHSNDTHASEPSSHPQPA